MTDLQKSDVDLFIKGTTVRMIGSDPVAQRVSRLDNSRCLPHDLTDFSYAWPAPFVCESRCATSRYNYDRNDLHIPAFVGGEGGGKGGEGREGDRSCEMKEPNNSLRRAVPPGLLLKLNCDSRE